MWTKQQIQELKRTAYTFYNDDYIGEHLAALNIHLNNADGQPLFHEKNNEWRAVEGEASLIAARVASLSIGSNSLN